LKRRFSGKSRLKRRFSGKSRLKRRFSGKSRLKRRFSSKSRTRCRFLGDAKAVVMVSAPYAADQGARPAAFRPANSMIHGIDNAISKPKIPLIKNNLCIKVSRG
jgi:hypothetical protein